MVTKVVNLFKEPYDVYIGRAGKGKSGYFGNPIPLKKGEERGSTLLKFREYFENRIKTDPEFKQNILSLHGKTLGCFCSPQACHGGIIVEYINQYYEQLSNPGVI